MNDNKVEVVSHVSKSPPRPSCLQEVQVDVGQDVQADAGYDVQAGAGYDVCVHVGSFALLLWTWSMDHITIILYKKRPRNNEPHYYCHRTKIEELWRLYFSL